MHLRSIRSLQPASRAARTVSSSSATVAMPVEMIIGLPGRRDSPHQGQMRVLERRDLVAGHVELFEKVDRRIIERRAESDHAEFARAIEDRLVPFPGVYAWPYNRRATFPPMGCLDC